MIKKWVVFILILFSIVITTIINASIQEEPRKINQISLKQVKGLQDCQFFAIEADGNKIYVIRCANSEVSTHWIKNSKNLFVLTSDESI